MNIVAQNRQMADCEVLTDYGQTVERSSEYSDTEPTDGRLCGSDRLWTDCRKEQ